MAMSLAYPLELRPACHRHSLPCVGACEDIWQIYANFMTCRTAGTPSSLLVGGLPQPCPISCSSHQHCHYLLQLRQKDTVDFFVVSGPPRSYPTRSWSSWWTSGPLSLRSQPRARLGRTSAMKMAPHITQCQRSRGTVVGTWDLPSGIPVMHTIHDPKKSVVNPHNQVDIKVTSSIAVPK
jgi:hypothetical protein